MRTFSVLAVLVAALITLSSQRPTSPQADFDVDLLPRSLQDDLLGQKIPIYHSHPPSLQARDSTDPIASLEYLSAGAFSTLVTVGTEVFSLLIDTGSAATWLAASNVSCLVPGESPGLSTPASNDCGYSTTMSPANEDANVQPLLSPGSTSPQAFAINYASGAFVAGTLATAELSIADLSVPKHTLALISYSTVNASSGADGILGLAFSSLNRPTGGTGAGFPSLTDAIVADNLTPPLLSLALARDAANTGYGGAMMFGRLFNAQDPGVNVSAGASSVTVPMLRCGLTGCSSASASPAFAALPYGWYAVNVTGIVRAPPASDPSGAVPVATAVNATDQPFVLDTGTTFNHLPPTLAALLNAQFTPPATLYPLSPTSNSPSEFLYIAPCAATTPPVGIQIGGAPFYMSAAEMLSQEFRVNSTHCVCGNQAGGEEGVGVLGGTFLKNVLVEIDLAAKTVALSARERYAGADAAAGS